MFDFFKKKEKGIEIGSPVKGKTVAISNVSDPTFGEEILGKHDQQKRGHQDVVQQDEPTGHEAHMRVDGALHVGVHRARDGELAGHRGVAQGCEADGNESDDVHERGQTTGINLQRAPDGLR